MRARRFRLHQSWYRAAVLKLSSWGVTPRGGALGSILAPQDAEAGLNLMSEHAHRLYDDRRRTGWGIDPFRVQSYMTSSQALLINLVGPMLACPGWLRDWLRVVLREETISEVLRAEVEFAPRTRSNYMNDMTMVDFFVTYRSVKGLESTVFEFKYADRFSSRKVEISKNHSYIDLLDSGTLWRSQEALVESRFNQLSRCHALATSVSRRHADPTSTATLVVVATDNDSAALRLLDDYRKELIDPHTSSLLTLETAIASAALSAPNVTAEESMHAIWLRYVHFEASDFLMPS